MAKIKLETKITIILWLLGTIATVLFGSTLTLGIKYLDCRVDLSQKIEEYNRCELDYKELRTAYDKLSDNCSKLQVQYEGLERTYADLQDAYRALQVATKIEFDSELLVENIDNTEKIYIKGTVQNISTKPMEKVKIFIAIWGKNRTLINVASQELTSLALGETQKWSVYVGSDYEYFNCYAIGNYK
jgi:predicted nuclease with TOPRIM domain